MPRPRAQRAIELLELVRIPGRQAARRRISPPPLRRHAAARDDRDRDRLPPAPPDRRRADHRARRHHPGPDPRSAARAAVEPRHVGDPDFARHGRDRRIRPARRRDVCRAAWSRPRRSKTCSASRCTPTPRACWRRSPSSMSMSTRLPTIRGSIPDPAQAIQGCRYGPRCPVALDSALSRRPPCCRLDLRASRAARHGWPRHEHQRQRRSPGFATSSRSSRSNPTRAARRCSFTRSTRSALISQPAKRSGWSVRMSCCS